MEGEHDGDIANMLDCINPYDSDFFDDSDDDYVPSDSSESDYDLPSTSTGKNVK